MYTEAELLPLSALQHFVFCRRQCALIHIEGLWMENRLTMEGRILHHKVHHAGPEYRDGVRIERGIPLVCKRLGVIGKSDVVEFHPSPVGDGPEAIAVPVEYKRGRPKPDHSDLVQLTAQALCLEEMTGVPVREGAIFYGQPRRRMSVTIDDTLCTETAHVAEQLHRFVSEGHTPPAQYNRKCDNCSFLELCLPKTCAEGTRVSRYIHRMTRDVGANEPW